MKSRTGIDKGIVSGSARRERKKSNFERIEIFLKKNFFLAYGTHGFTK